MFKVKKLSMIIGAALSMSAHASSHDSSEYNSFYFPTSAVTNYGETSADLSIFFNETGLAPGVYNVSVIVNARPVDDGEKIKFSVCGNKLCPEFTYKQLEGWGVRIDDSHRKDNVNFSPLEKFIPYASTKLDAETMRLYITVPMTYWDEEKDDSSKWDDGINMAFTNYNASYSKSKYKNSHDYQTQYLSLYSGVNIGPWRFRNSSYYNKYGNNNAKWTNNEKYVERNIRPIRANLTIGEFATPGLILDGYMFKGLSLSSDDEMLNDNQQGFAPVVRGQALTNARVVIKQNNNIIYDQTITPGPFEITNLYPTSNSGDLDVEVIEENGTVQKFTQPFSAAPIMVREGSLKFNIAAGKYNELSSSPKKENFSSAELMYGLLSETTIYGGFIHSKSYDGGKMGIGQGLGMLGAVSIDFSLSKSLQRDKTLKGRALEAKYSKSMTKTGTTFTLAGYKYSSSGYQTFSEAMNQYYESYNSSYTPKQVFQLSINQSLNEYGSLNISAYEQTYWNRSSKTRTVTGGYSTSYESISLNANVTNNKYQDKTDRIYSLSVSMPLDKLFGNKLSNQRLLYSYSNGGRNNTYSRASVTGSLLKENNLYYNLSQTMSDSPDGDSSSISATYTGNRGTINAGYSQSGNNIKRTNLGVNGSVGLFKDGIFMGQTLSQNGANAIVVAPGANNVKILNKTAVYTDNSGVAVVSNLGNYRGNSISIDTTNLPNNIDITESNKRIVPTRGALVRVDYPVKIGSKVYANFINNGNPLPLGTVIDEGKDTESIVGQNGEAFITAYKKGHTFKVKSGQDSLICSISDKDLTPSESGIMIAQANCR